MSRGGRGGGRIGGGAGGGGAFGAASLQAMGLTFADIQNMSREQAELYPPYGGLPTLTEPSEEEKKICALQEGFVDRLRGSCYFLVGGDVGVRDDLSRYSDKYRPSPAARPTLKRKDLHAPFFPQEIFEDYFNPRRRRGVGKRREKKRATKKVKLDEMAGAGAGAGAGEGDEEQDPAVDKPSPAGARSVSEDEAVEEEDDDDDVDDELGENDYVENYFDNGEGDDLDDLGDGGAGGGGDGGDYD